MNPQLSLLLAKSIQLISPQCVPRCFGTVTAPTVKLSFDKYDVKREGTATGCPVIIMHGLFGSRQNWRAIAKRLNADLNPYRAVSERSSLNGLYKIKSTPFQIYAVDARNHGLSPRHPETNYDAMADDLKELYRHLGITKAALLGHSMGGRTMINLALKYVGFDYF